MDIRRYRYQYSVVSAVILLIACGQSAFAQYISYQGPSQQSNPLDIASILQLIFKGQFYDKVGVSAEPTTTTTSTTTSTTKSVNLNNYLNGDGSVNRDRAGLLPSYLTTTTRSPAQDRAQGNTPSWLDILLRRFPTQTIKPQYRSYDEAETTEVTSASSTATTKKNNGALLVTNDAVFIFNSNSAKSTPQPNKESPTPNTKEIQVEVQDKPFTGVPKDFFDHKQRKRSAERDTDIRENKTEAPETHQTTGGLNCLALEQFAPCEYHRQCFAKNVESCQVRGSYIGDEADRLCQAAQKIVGSTQSEPVSTRTGGTHEGFLDHLESMLSCLISVGNKPFEYKEMAT
ncbi:hypothetical protein BgiBS90_000916 [Biomphalaria glabrata]|nr:hypothetical protein BgiBS90_000916 [Biomphalaria glabrata]